LYSKKGHQVFGNVQIEILFCLNSVSANYSIINPLHTIYFKNICREKISKGETRQRRLEKKKLSVFGCGSAAPGVSVANCRLARALIGVYSQKSLNDMVASGNF